MQEGRRSKYAAYYLIGICVARFDCGALAMSRLNHSLNPLLTQIIPSDRGINLPVTETWPCLGCVEGKLFDAGGIQLCFSEGIKSAAYKRDRYTGANMHASLLASIRLVVLRQHSSNTNMALSICLSVIANEMDSEK